MATDIHDLTTELTAGAGPSPPRVVALWNGGSVSRTLGQGESITLGRARDCDVVIDHPSVSRRHAVVIAGPPLQIEDLQSANGTRIGGIRISSPGPVPLGPGQAIAIGVAVVIVHGDDAALESARPPPSSRDGMRDDGIVVFDEAMKKIHALIARIAPSPLSVVLLGQTGVGKDVLAEAIHRRSSRKGALVRVNCAAMPANLFESELFGFERGAFTGAAQAKQGLLEAADGGTLFLDEIAEMPPPMQAKLLHVLERGEVMRVGALRPRPIDVRFVAATNRDLDALVADGSFRADLYYRLHGMGITIPPLAQRAREIASLAQLFVLRACQRAGRSPLAISDDAIDRLNRYSWPGNVRELRNVMERAAALCGGEVIAIDHLPPAVTFGALGVSPTAAPPAPQPLVTQEVANEPAASEGGVAGLALRDSLRATERQQIVEALARCAGNQSAAATLLGISRRTLVTRLGEYDIPRPQKRK